MPARGPVGGRALCTPHSLQEQSLGGVGTPAAFVSMAAEGLNSHPCSVPLNHPCYNEPAAVGQRVTVGRTSPPPHLLWTSPVPPSLGFHGSVWQRGIYFKTLAGMPGGSRRHAGLGVRGDAQQMSAHSAQVPSKASHPSPPSHLTPVRQETHYYPILQMRRLRHRARKGRGQGRKYSQSAEPGFELRFPWIPSPGLYSLLASWPGLSCSGRSSAMGPTGPWVNPFTSPRLCKMGW